MFIRLDVCLISVIIVFTVITVAIDRRMDYKKKIMRRSRSEAPAKRPRTDYVETDEEKLTKVVFKAISDGDLDGLKKIREEQSFSTEIIDDNGMTPILLAAKQGDEEMVRWLLDRGADISPGKHLHALHKAAFAGHPNVCSILLEAGANKELTDNCGRTAAQLATVGGNYDCVAVIRNFVTEEQLKLYTLLDPSLVQPFRQFIITPYIHPTKVVSEVPPVLLKNNVVNITQVLQEMCKRVIEEKVEDNEVMAFRFHYLANILAEVYRIHLSSNRKKSPIKIVIKRMLKSKAYTEEFLIGCIQLFPFKECKIFKQMIDALFKGDKRMTALTVILTMIGNERKLGVHFGEYVRICSVCGKNNCTIKCDKCRDVQYCDQKCQRIHKFVHKNVCQQDTSGNGTL